MRPFSLLALCAAAACGGGSPVPNTSTDNTNVDAQLAAQLAESGVECAPPPHPQPPPPPPPLAEACKDKHAGDACFLHAGDVTIIGFCTDLPGRTTTTPVLLACIPPPPAGFIQACATLHPSNDCSVD